MPHDLNEELIQRYFYSLASPTSHNWISSACVYHDLTTKHRGDKGTPLVDAARIDPMISAAVDDLVLSTLGPKQIMMKLILL